MKQYEREEQIIKLFDEKKKPLSNAEIEKELKFTGASTFTKKLVYYRYLERDEENKTFKRTRKKYNLTQRAQETDSEEEKNYEMVLNKVFTGSFLYHNLGHELINFMKDQDGNRYIYLNPWGNRGIEAENETRYVFHIIESSLKDEKGMYEIVAVSEVDTNNDSEDYYSRTGDRTIEKEHSPIYHNHSFYDIFYCGPKSDLAHIYTYRASRLLVPAENIRIVVKIKSDEASLDPSNPNHLKISLMCNPQHDIAYADNSGKKYFDSQRNANTDVSVLSDLINLENGYMREATDDDIDIENLDDEQCFAVISDRTNLEDSTSNQIAYFLGRDKSLLYGFIHDFLGVSNVSREETFEVFREENKIDLLFLSDEHAIVVENKIDSSINGKSKRKNRRGKYKSQLSVYYDLLHKKNDKRFNEIDDENKKFFVLAPEYNPINEQELSTVYEKGDQYAYKTYNQLLAFIQRNNYRPMNMEPSQLGEFMYKEFEKTIEYISWSKAKQRERTAYIRLKQKITELDNQ